MLLVILLAFAIGGGAAWMQFCGNPELTGATMATPPKAPNVLWTYEAGKARSLDLQDLNALEIYECSW